MDDLSSLSAGSYSTTVTDANGCFVTLDFDVTEPVLLEVVVNTEDVSCNGLSDGSVTVEISGGSEEYNYEIQETSIDNFESSTSSMSFDGIDDYLEIPNSSSLDIGSGSFSLEFWVKKDTPYNNETTARIIGVYGPGENGAAGFSVGINGPYYPDYGTGTIHFGLRSSNNDEHHLQTPEEINITDGEWHYIVAIKDAENSSMSLYFDGDLADTEVIVSGETWPDNGLFFGHGYNTPFMDFNIDEFRYWDKALSEQEISEYMLCPPSADESDLIGYWDFEDTEDSESFLDLSSNGNHGLINGGAQYSDDFAPQECGVVADDLNNLSAGDYVITTTDSNGCSDVTEFTIFEPVELSISLESIPGDYSNCSSGTASVFVEGGTLDYEYLWSNGSTTSEITGLCGGEYSVIVTDANGCQIEGIVIVDYLIPEGWEVTETDSFHTINIPSEAIMLLDQINLIEGDYIGVFFDNNDGTQTCGGYVMFEGESNLQLIAYGNDDFNNGFEQGEQFNWVVWNSETETEAFGFAVYDDSYPDERYFTVNGESGIIGTVCATYQIIPINENPYSDWDIISTYMYTDEGVESLCAPIGDDLIILKDALEGVYWPGVVQTLENMTVENAYAIKTWAPHEMTVVGQFIQPEEISWLLDGWNYISYPRYFPEEVDIALADLNGNLKIVKDDSGNLYWPELGINTIGEMEAGEGYVLKVFNAQNFNYPSNSDNVDAVDGSTTSQGRIGLHQTVNYPDIEKTNSNMVIGLPLDSWVDFELEYGDELAVFDSYGEMVGVSVLDNDNNVVVIWADDYSSSYKDGMLEYEQFTIELWDQSSDTHYNLNIEWLEGSDYFSVNGINIAASIVLEKKYDNNVEYISCFPNPSSGDVSLEFYLIEDDYISVTIFNAIGERVYVLNNSWFNQGLNNIPISLSNLRQGLYYMELQSIDSKKTLVIELTK